MNDFIIGAKNEQINLLKWNAMKIRKVLTKQYEKKKITSKKPV